MVVDLVLAIVVVVCLVPALQMLLVAQRLRRLPWKAMRTQLLTHEAVPAEARRILDQANAQLLALGFVYRYSGATENLLAAIGGAVWNYSDIYQHADGHTHAVATPSSMPERQQPCVIQFVTCTTDGNNLTTVNRYRHYLSFSQPGWQVFDDYLPSLEQAWQRHLARVSALGTRTTHDGIVVSQRLRQASEQWVPALAAQGWLHAQPGNAGYYTMRHLAAWRYAWSMVLGQWRCALLPQAAVKSEDSNANTNTSSLAADMRAFHEQLALLRTKTASARQKWLVFLVTGLLFLLVGGFWLSWSLVPVVLAVVALHEGGHYLAMRLTGYRNVSVFFLPGLGGLATGEKFDATPLEKLLVYLAGPLPGMILAGAALGLFGLGSLSGPQWLGEFLLVSLVINYLNLLPITPLDGGKVVEVLVFARLPLLRFVFAAMSCLLLLAVGLWLRDTVALVLAVLLALGLPQQWRLMRLARAVPQRPQGAATEAEAVEQIFTGLQQPPFQSWSFNQRTSVALALLPELRGRRPRAPEIVFGLCVYVACLLSPIGLVYVLVPQSRQIVGMLWHTNRIPADDVEAQTESTPELAPIQIGHTQWQLAQTLDANGDAAAAQDALQARIAAWPRPDATDRSRRALHQRIGRVQAQIDLVWFLLDHGQADAAHTLAVQTLGAIPPRLTMSWVIPQQQALEALFWAKLGLGQKATLLAAWRELDAARQRLGMVVQPSLVHELDRALVAAALHDAALQQQAHDGIEAAMARIKTRPLPLCQSLADPARPNWRRPQREARTRLLNDLGFCAAT